MEENNIQLSRVEYLESLYYQHGPAILRYLKRLVDRQTAEDLLQDTFVQALSHFDRLDSVVSVRAWLFTVARHIALNSLRRKQVIASISWEQLIKHSAQEDPRLESIRKAIKRLPNEHQETLFLRWQDQLSYEEISEVLKIPVGTVRSRLHNAISKLRTLLEIEIPSAYKEIRGKE
jgi:RNA polymerase sigma-70 factor (ECF subfamily)